MLDRKTLKRIFFGALRLVRWDRRLLGRIRAGDFAPVLNLHRVSPHVNPFYNPMHPRIFEELLVYLKREFEVTTFDALSRADGARPPVILSFDDGYYDFVEYAMPILKKHGLRANQNIITHCARSGELPPHQRIYDFLNTAPPNLINELDLPGFGSKLGAGDDHARMAFGLRLSKFLKLRPREEREALWPRIEALIAKTDRIRWTRMMRTKEIQEAARLHEIGAHSNRHDSMGFEGDAFFQEDLKRCRSYFQDELRLPLSIYAFPQGSFRPALIDILSKEGFRHILLVGERLCRRWGPVYTRITISGDSSDQVILQALGYRAEIPE